MRHYRIDNVKRKPSNYLNIPGKTSTFFLSTALEREMRVMPVDFNCSYGSQTQLFRSRKDIVGLFLRTSISFEYRQMSEH